MGTTARYPSCYSRMDGIGGLVLWGASHIVRTLLLLTLASLLAYALAPGVKAALSFHAPLSGDSDHVSVGAGGT